MTNNKELLILFILAAVAILAWVGTDIYRTQTSIEISPELQIALEPINPNFDTQTLELINNLNTPQIGTDSGSISP